MSAFIVDDAHISAIIRFAAFHQVSFYHPVEKTRVRVNWNNADDMGRLLLAENVRSVNFRYNETMTDELRERIAGYRCPLHGMPQTPVPILKAIDGLFYQSCETDDWRETPAAWLLGAIQSEAISKLPGYAAAQWHITD